MFFEEAPASTASPASSGVDFSYFAGDNAKLILFFVIGIVVIFLLMELQEHQQSLNNVKLKRAGDGQYGVARWMTRDEALHPEKYPDKATHKTARRTMKQIEFTPMQWRGHYDDDGNFVPGKNLPDTPGILLGDWHGGKAKKVNKEDWPYYVDWSKGGYDFKGSPVFSILNYQDAHVQVTAGSGTGKTACFLFPQLEYGCACGISMLVTDTKGDIARDYGPIAEKCYGYKLVVIDLRNPMASSGFNIMHMVNKYYDLYEACPDKSSPDAVAYRAKEENFAKIVAKTIIMQGNDGSGYGQNAFFYESAEGLLAAAIMIVAEYSDRKDERHIVSVYKLVQSICGVDKKSGVTEVQKLLNNLPPNSDIAMLAGSAAQSGGDAQASVISTAMSKMLAFIDKETEQILCFQSDIDAEDFCHQKTLIVLTMAEEHPERYFIVSLIIQELYRELLKLADENSENPGKIPMTDGFLGVPDKPKSDKDRDVKAWKAARKAAMKKARAIFFLDEFGTLPPISEADKMFSAARSRHIFLVPIVQGNIQLEKNYNKAGASIIKDNCAIQIFSGQSPQSDDSEKFSKDLGSYTVESGNVSNSNRSGAATSSHSQSKSLIKRELMTADEIRTMPTGTWIVMMTGRHPMQINIDLYLDWGMPPLDEQPPIAAHNAREVHYVSRELIEAAMREAADEDAGQRLGDRKGMAEATQSVGKRLFGSFPDDEDDSTSDSAGTEPNKRESENSVIAPDDLPNINEDPFDAGFDPETGEVIDSPDNDDKFVADDADQDDSDDDSGNDFGDFN